MSEGREDPSHQTRSSESRFEILEHTADIGFRAWGRTAGELFENAAHALMSIATDARDIGRSEQRDIAASGADYESLMVNWLSEIVYAFDAGLFAPADFRVYEIMPTELKALWTGEPRDPRRHPWKLIVKAITYHQIEVAERAGRWQTTVFVDI
jgi:SHS2 domain-containing protein